eukprot:8480457-Alexandrium_andersonii.AAC.1
MMPQPPQGLDRVLASLIPQAPLPPRFSVPVQSIALPALPPVDPMPQLEHGVVLPLLSAHRQAQLHRNTSIDLQLIGPSGPCLLYTSPSPRD